jgi:ATP-dependent protease La (LON) substrate-binding domain
MLRPWDILVNNWTFANLRRVDELTLDELAVIVLPLPIIDALAEIDIEYPLWERSRTMNTNPAPAASPARASAHRRFLPVVVLGNMVALPSRYPLQLLIRQPGRSYRAIHAARDRDHEVVLIFVPEREIESYRSSEPPPFPSIGVIARLTDIVSQSDGVLELVMDVTTRATITARHQHDPYYLAACVPHPDPDVTVPEIPAVMAGVKAQVAAMA